MMTVAIFTILGLYVAIAVAEAGACLLSYSSDISPELRRKYARGAFLAPLWPVTVIRKLGKMRRDVFNTPE